jgi:hypothetical protein
MAKGTGSIGEIRKKVTKTHELISTSYHEAGHTIYALLHLMKVSSVSVFENKKLKRIHGITYYDYPNDFDSIKDSELLAALVRADIGMSYSGLIAEKTLFKSISGSNQTPMFISDGSTEDNKAAREIIKKYNIASPGQKRATYKQKLMREVRAELHEHWDAVTVISHALFRYRKLGFDDLRNILIKKSRNKKFWKDQFRRINNFYDNNKVLDETNLRAILSR